MRESVVETHDIRYGFPPTIQLVVIIVACQWIDETLMMTTVQLSQGQA